MNKGEETGGWSKERSKGVWGHDLRWKGTLSYMEKMAAQHMVAAWSYASTSLSFFFSKMGMPESSYGDRAMDHPPAFNCKFGLHPTKAA